MFKSWKKLSPSLIFAINLENYSEIQTSLEEYESDTTFNLVGVLLKSKKIILSSSSKEFSYNLPKELGEKSHLLQWNKSASTFLYLQPIYYDDEFLGHLFGFLNLTYVSTVMPPLDCFNYPNMRFIPFIHSGEESVCDYTNLRILTISKFQEEYEDYCKIKGLKNDFSKDDFFETVTYLWNKKEPVHITQQRGIFEECI